MTEREIVKNILDLSFIIKAQLKSDETALLRSILSIAIMESEDILEAMDEKSRKLSGNRAISARG